MRGSGSPPRPVGWAGQRPAHASRNAGSNGRPTQCWRWWERRQQPASASRGLAWRASATRSSLPRRPDRTLFAASAARGGTPPPSTQSNSLVCPLQGGPPDVRPLAPSGGVPGQAGPRVCTRGGQAQKLLGIAPLPGQRVPGEEARRAVKGWRPPSPPRRERRASGPPEGETPESPLRGQGEMEVEAQPGVEAGGGKMAE